MSQRGELFHAVFEHAHEAQLIADDQRHYLDGNRAARNLLGVSRETLLASRVDDYTPSNIRGDLDRMWETFLARGSMDGVFPLRLANGLERTISFSAKANVRPGRHLSSFQIAGRASQPTELELQHAQSGAQLTFREREVMTLLARGTDVEGIAERVTLSPDTIRTHLRNAMKKLGARSRAHAVAVAIRLRQIDP